MIEYLAVFGLLLFNAVAVIALFTISRNLRKLNKKLLEHDPDSDQNNRRRR
jgi:hypothetical protein